MDGWDGGEVGGLSFSVGEDASGTEMSRTSGSEGGFGRVLCLRVEIAPSLFVDGMVSSRPNRAIMVNTLASRTFQTA